MEDEFYAIIKLVSGEEIFSLVLVDNYQDENTVIALQNPVMMWSNVTPNGTFIKVKPWMELTDEDIFMIHLDKVITMDEILLSEEYYLTYIDMILIAKYYKQLKA